MRYFGEIPRALGFKRKPSPDLARLLDVLNEEDPHVYTFDAWEQIVADLEADLACIQALQAEAERPFDESTAGAITIPNATTTPRRARWEPPFDLPSSLARRFEPQRDYLSARHGLWALWQTNAARLVHRCFGKDCPEKPYVFARETCQELRCIVGALRHARRHEANARDLLRLWNEIRRRPDVSDDDLIALDAEFPPLAIRRRV